ncbi:hypothetical protein [Pseudomonas lundensis]|uniref:hypothetical protein n=1 Tax=Pseudomonas lundensis TaxID=86185 RepID=UPI00089DCF09|nr:hypothetical protein [Pseudomonas lundensis]
MLSLLKNEDLKGPNAAQVLNGVTKVRASFYQVMYKQGVTRSKEIYWLFFKQKPLKSAQEVAQYCATSCALVYSSRFIWIVAMYPHSYPHLSAQLLAQLVFF